MYTRKFFQIATLLLLVFFPHLSVSRFSANEIRMFIWSAQIAPILSTYETTPELESIQKYQGIVRDVVDSMNQDGKYRVTVHQTSRTRGEKGMYDGAYDLTVLAPQWVQTPDALLFSKPIYIHKEFLYSFSPIKEESLEDAISNKKVCVRHSYKFPKVQPYFDNNTAIRIDAFEEASGFAMLERGRCDLMLTNEFVGDQIVNQGNFQTQVYKSAFTTNEVAFTFALNASKTSLLFELNQHIDKLNQSGELAKFIHYHRNKPIENLDI